MNWSDLTTAQGGMRLWTEAISDHAAQVDLLMVAFTLLLLALTVPVGVLLVWFLYRYREGSNADRSDPPKRSMKVEVAWASIPFVLALVFFVWAAKLFVEQQSPPDDALQINVVARQWMWKFQHPGGQREIDVLHVPKDTPVVLRMISQDVIHSLFFPALRIKQDVLPDRYTTLWFEATRTGTHHLLCAEYCGSNHSHMTGRIVVMEPEDYAAWLDEREPDQSLVARGEKLFRAYGCSGCHGAESVARAPDLSGVYGSPVPLSDGGTITADETYLRDSILFPKKAVVAGYRPIMPSFEGQVSEEDLVELVAYVKSLALPDREPDGGER